ncbi:daptide-type RiPP [Streptomyces erythrochromogenes]|uniref:daptide-type RiPP n=1 Tax=Streptomyces erythrochromogenes TaxID=285574 RepID=UPI00368C49C5
MPALELGMQELEAMEAPGWSTWAGFGTGTVVTSAIAYGSVYVAVSGAAIT